MPFKTPGGGKISISIFVLKFHLICVREIVIKLHTLHIFTDMGKDTSLSVQHVSFSGYSVMTRML
jgi:hypothetical protein